MHRASVAALFRDRRDLSSSDVLAAASPRQSGHAAPWTPKNWSWQPTVATKIKLMRLGKMRAPYYRIVVADARTKRDGRVIETIGKYHPKEDPCFIEVDSDRAQYWLGVGAQPTEPVAAILKVTGDWQKFKGEPAPAPMKVAEPKRDKAEIFGEAARAAAGLSDSSRRPRHAAQEEQKPAAPSRPPGRAPEPAADAPAAAGAAGRRDSRPPE